MAKRARAVSSAADALRGLQSRPSLLPLLARQRADVRKGWAETRRARSRSGNSARGTDPRGATDSVAARRGGGPRKQRGDRRYRTARQVFDLKQGLAQKQALLLQIRCNFSQEPARRTCIREGAASKALSARSGRRRAEVHGSGAELDAQARDTSGRVALARHCATGLTLRAPLAGRIRVHIRDSESCGPIAARVSYPLRVRIDPRRGACDARGALPRPRPCARDGARCAGTRAGRTSSCSLWRGPRRGTFWGRSGSRRTCSAPPTTGATSSWAASGRRCVSASPPTVVASLHPMHPLSSLPPHPTPASRDWSARSLVALRSMH